MTNSDEPVNRVELHLHTEHRVGEIDRRIFSGFLEHMGRAVYEGVYDPASPLADERGFRTDVLEALRPLRMPGVRYPGGNFVSNYRWRDGVGPKDQRPRRPDYAWRSMESNHFGTDEFMQWCEAVGTEPIMAVNLGTAGPADAADLVEYCNMPAGTSLADLRAANGHPDPYGVKLWCLGNEMDGPWQAGHVPAQTYAESARSASALMKGIDRTIETIACGSCDKDIPTFLEWDRTVLEHCWDRIDYLALHRYSRNSNGDTPTFLAEGVVIDDILVKYRGVLEYVRGIKRSNHRIGLSFDEWNVWYRVTGFDGEWNEAPHLLEEVYNIEDALVCAQYLNAFLRHADIVKIACLAQIVNVIAPVLTRTDGLLIQTIYWPFQLMSAAVSGYALRTEVRAPEIATAGHGDVPVVDTAATFDESDGTGCISVVHRDTSRSADVTIRIADRPVVAAETQVLCGDPKAQNDWDNPKTVAPSALAVTVTDDGILHLIAPPTSHLVLRYRAQQP